MSKKPTTEHTNHKTLISSLEPKSQGTNPSSHRFYTFTIISKRQMRTFLAKVTQVDRIARKSSDLQIGPFLVPAGNLRKAELQLPGNQDSEAFIDESCTN